MDPKAVLSLSEALAALALSRESLRHAMAEADGWALEKVVAPHLRLGTIDMYQWLVFLGRHERPPPRPDRAHDRGRRGALTPALSVWSPRSQGPTTAETNAPSPLLWPGWPPSLMTAYVTNGLLPDVRVTFA